MLEHRHVDERSRAARLQGVGERTRARVGAGIGDDHRLAALEVIDVGAEIPEAQRSGEGGCAAGGPVPLDGDRFGMRVHQPVAHELHIQRPAEHVAGDVGEGGRIVIVLGKLVAQLEQSLAAPLAFAQGDAGEVCGGTVAHDLDEAEVSVGVVAQRHHFAGGPEA